MIIDQSYVQFFPRESHYSTLRLTHRTPNPEISRQNKSFSRSKIPPPSTIEPSANDVDEVLYHAGHPAAIYHCNKSTTAHKQEIKTNCYHHKDGPYPKNIKAASAQINLLEVLLVVHQQPLSAC